MKASENNQADEKEGQIDPVCRMKIDTETADENIDYNGQTYLFCSPYCRMEFEFDPGKFL